jgi:hypothetical protein
MRFAFRALCAVALAGCSDLKTPAETKPIQVSAAPGGGSTGGTALPGSVDPRPVADRLDSLFIHQLGHVNIPADGFSQASDAVHPDMACPGAWNGARCWLIYTPYKNSDPSLENPAVLYAASDTTWITPPGVTNPIVPYPGIGYNSDPDHAFDPVTGRMVQVFRVVSDTVNKIMIMSTANARQWTKPVIAFQERAHDAVSPSLIIEPDRLAKLWYVKTGVAGCTATTSTVQFRSTMPDSTSGYEEATWSAPETVNLTLPGYVIWHLDVVELSPGGGYVALIAAFPRGSNCATSDLWLASSADGMTWQANGMPILWRTMASAKSRAITTWYRGTMRYDALTDSLDIWPSAMSKTSWDVYHARFKLADMLSMLGTLKNGDYKPSFKVANPIPAHMP